MLYKFLNINNNIIIYIRAQLFENFEIRPESLKTASIGKQSGNKTCETYENSIYISMTVVENPSAKNRKTEMGERINNNDDRLEIDDDTRLEPNLKGDKLNIALLVLLCTLQGIPVGISMAVRTYIQNSKVSYIEQVRIRT